MDELHAPPHSALLGAGRRPSTSATHDTTREHTRERSIPTRDETSRYRRTPGLPESGSGPRSPCGAVMQRRLQHARLLHNPPRCFPSWPRTAWIENVAEVSVRNRGFTSSVRRAAFSEHPRHRRAEGEKDGVPLVHAERPRLSSNGAPRRATLSVEPGCFLPVSKSARGRKMAPPRPSGSAPLHAAPPSRLPTWQREHCSGKQRLCDRPNSAWS